MHDRVHLLVALHCTLLHDPRPHCTLQVEPPQVTAPHAVEFEQSMSQALAALQSTARAVPAFTTQGMPGGQVT